MKACIVHIVEETIDVLCRWRYMIVRIDFNSFEVCDVSGHVLMRLQGRNTRSAATLVYL